MQVQKNFSFNLVAIAKAFGLRQTQESLPLSDWLAAEYEFDEFEAKVLGDTLDFIGHYNEQMNEEELKVRMIAPLFYVAKVDDENKLMVFYERPLSATVNGFDLSVVTDCMVATPIFNAPDAPYFFLQEFKKKKGDKKDPEAQMLVAMLIAQSINDNGKPVYGGYLIGTSWKFAVLDGKNYTVSPIFEATKKIDLYKIASIVRKIKTL